MIKKQKKSVFVYYFYKKYIFQLFRNSLYINLNIERKIS